MKNKFVCIHGHFYQPPRENPWLGAGEPEASAHPYRGWNERIFEECYAQNAAVPLLAGPDHRIDELVSNYEKLSWDFGPSLLSWLERERADFYEGLVAADARSARERDGHGNAVAHPYYHDVLPLQTLADKRTLVRWGLQDFEARFGRKAEGFWLPETAVDDETLEVLVERGLRYTILSPLQAARLREVGSGEEGWKEATERKLAPTRPYRWLSKAQPGKSLAIFFYHEKLSKGVVSGESLKGPSGFFRKIHARFLPNDSTQMVSVASDGEFYGHHHRHGAAALAQTFSQLEAAGLSPVNYGQFLDLVPPPQEVELKQDTAWSCEHGLGRWTRDCGCRSPQLPDWSQQWRGPMRGALNELAARLDELYDRKAGGYFRDFRAARDDVFAPRELERLARVELTPEERADALCLLELLRQRLAMFTSCGWFFDDVSGLEATQCLMHAARAVELARRFGADLEPALVEGLRAARSNVRDFKDGAGAWKKLVRPRACDLPRAAAHFALCRHVDGFWAQTYGFDVSARGHERADKQGLAGRDRALSFCGIELVRRATEERLSADVFVYQRDRVDFLCWVVEPGKAAFAELAARFAGLDDEPFVASATRRLGAPTHTLEALFSEERRNALRVLMPGPGDSAERKAFLSRWRTAMARLVSPEDNSNDERELLELLAGLKDSGLALAQLPWSSRLPHALARVLERVIERPTPDSMSRGARWLEAFEAAGAPVSLWRLRFFYWRWREALRARGAATPSELDAAAALGEKLGFSEKAVAAAGRPA